MTKKSPLQTVNDLHGGKEKLVDKLMGLLNRGEESKDEFRARLLAAKNSKLLRLFDTMTGIKEQFGNEEGLVDAILELMKRTKDSDYKEKLQALSPTRLFDLHRSWKKKAKAA